MKKIMILIIVIIGVWFVWSHFIKPDKWQIIYSTQSGSYSYGEYSSSDACLQELRSGTYPNGECGSNCKARSSVVGTIYHCKDTLDN